jgi:hypothetical protein
MAQKRLKKRRARKPPGWKVESICDARREGATLREAAKAGGIHVATLCRWCSRHPAIREALEEAHQEAQAGKQPKKAYRPSVRTRMDCPLCRARVVVRKHGSVPFWRCGRWPLCSWASWRPRYPRNCSRCGGPRFWSRSRKSVVCPACGLRTKRPLTAVAKCPWNDDFPLGFG